MVDRTTAMARTLTPQRLKGWMVYALALLPFILGWLLGVIVRLVIWVIAAMLAGFQAGRGH